MKYLRETKTSATGSLGINFNLCGVDGDALNKMDECKTSSRKGSVTNLCFIPARGYKGAIQPLNLGSIEGYKDARYSPKATGRRLNSWQHKPVQFRPQVENSAAGAPRMASCRVVEPSARQSLLFPTHGTWPASFRILTQRTGNSRTPRSCQTQRLARGCGERFYLVGWVNGDTGAGTPQRGPNPHRFPADFNFTVGASTRSE